MATTATTTTTRFYSFKVFYIRLKEYFYFKKEYWIMNYNKNKRFFFWFIATEILKMVLEILNLRAIYIKIIYFCCIYFFFCFLLSPPLKYLYDWQKIWIFFKQTYWFNYLVQAIVARIYAWWFFSFLLLLVYYRPALYYYSWSLTLLIQFYCLI